MTVPMASSRASPAAVDRAGASKGDQREVAGVAAALRRDRAQGAHGAGVGDAVDALGRGEQVEAERGSDAVGDHSGGRFRVDADLAVGERSRADVPEGDVGVGQGRLGAAAAVADRTGNRSGAARADPQAAGGVEEGDACRRRPRPRLCRGWERVSARRRPPSAGSPADRVEPTSYSGL